jgi:hypothetical protein
LPPGAKKGLVAILFGWQAWDQIAEKRSIHQRVGILFAPWSGVTSKSPRIGASFMSNAEHIHLSVPGLALSESHAPTSHIDADLIFSEPADSPWDGAWIDLGGEG